MEKSCNELDQQNYKLYNIKSFIVQKVLAVIHSIHHTHSCIKQQDSLKNIKQKIGGVLSCCVTHALHKRPELQ